MSPNIVKKYPFTCATTLVVCILSLAPIGAPEIAGDVPFFDKWAHCVMYGSLTCVVWFDMRLRPVTMPRAIVCGFLYPILLGGLMEVCQTYLTTYRSGEWLDFAANSLGVAAGLVVGTTMRWAYRKKCLGR